MAKGLGQMALAGLSPDFAQRPSFWRFRHTLPLLTKLVSLQLVLRMTWSSDLGGRMHASPMRPRGSRQNSRDLMKRLAAGFGSYDQFNLCQNFEGA